MNTKMVIKWVDNADDNFHFGLYRFDKDKIVVEICWSKWSNLADHEKEFFREEILDDKYVRAL